MPRRQHTKVRPQQHKRQRVRARAERRLEKRRQSVNLPDHQQA